MKISDKNLRLILLGILTLGTIVTFFPSLHNDFAIWVDDGGLVTANPKIMELSWQNTKAIWTTPHTGLYVPLVLFSYSIEFRLFGLDPFAFHVTNLALHVANGVLVFFLILLISKRQFTAFVVAMLFALHPLHVESVAWISERKDVLYSFFFLLSLLSYLFFREKGKRAYYGVSVLCFLLSLLSKAMAVTLPVLLVAVEFLPGKNRNNRRFADKIPFVLFALVFAVVNLVAQYSFTNRALAVSGISWSKQVISAGYSLLFYGYKMFVPLDLSFQYQFPFHDTILTAPVLLFSPIMIIVLLCLLAVYARKYATSLCRYKSEYPEGTNTVFAGFAFYIITLLPVILVPFGPESPADRYTYIPLIGLFYPMAAGWTWVYDRCKGAVSARAGVLVVSVFLCVSLAALSWQRCAVWKNSVTVLEDSLRHNPRWAHAYYGAGLACKSMKEYDKAAANVIKAIELGKNRYECYQSLGDIYAAAANHAAALNEYRKAARMRPRDTQIINKIVQSHIALGEYAQARERCADLIQADPCNADAYVGLGAVSVALKDDENAEKQFQRALSLAPASAQVHYNYGLFCMKMKRPSAAIAEFEKTVSLDKLMVEAYNNLGALYCDRRDFTHAASVYRAAIKVDPGNAITHYNLGNVYLKQGRFDNARDEYIEAIGDNGDTADLDMRYNLGLAYAHLHIRDKSLEQFTLIYNHDPHYPGIAKTIDKVSRQ